MRKKYFTLDEVPLEEIEGVVKFLQQGQEKLALEYADRIFSDVKNLMHYEAWLCFRNLRRDYLNQPDKVFTVKATPLEYKFIYTGEFE